MHLSEGAAGQGGHPAGADASGTGHALEPADPGHAQGHGPAAVREAVSGFRADAGGYLRRVRLAAGFFLEASGVCEGSSGISPSSRWSSAGEGLFHQGGKSFATVGGGVRLAAGFFLE